MTKRELINEIMEINHSADPGFLAHFNDAELYEYLGHLHCLNQPRPCYDSVEQYAQVATVQTATAVAEPAPVRKQARITQPIRELADALPDPHDRFASKFDYVERLLPAERQGSQSVALQFRNMDTKANIVEKKPLLF